MSQLSISEPIQRSLAALVRRGITWNLAGLLSVRALNLLFLIAVARILTPEDYGLYGIAYASMGLIVFCGDLGLGSAAIQSRKPAHEILSAAFYLNLAVAIAASAALWAAAPILTSYYEKEALTELTRLLALSFFLKSVAGIHQAHLRRSLRYGPLQAILLCAAMVQGGVSLLCATAGFGAESLAWGLVAGNALLGFLLLASGAPIRLRLHHELWRELLGFGMALFLAGVLWSVVLYIDNLAVGKLWGVELLGFYALGYSLGRLPETIIGSAVGDVLFSGFSRCQADDQRSLMLKTSIEWLGYIMIPLAIFMALYGSDIIALALGARWMGAAEVFRIFSAGFCVAALASPIPAVLYAKGRPDVPFWAGLAALLLMGGAILFVLPFGISSMAFAVVGIMLATAAGQALIAARLLRAPVFGLASALLPSLICIIAGFSTTLALRAISRGLGIQTPWPIEGATLLGGYGAFLALAYPERLRPILEHTRDFLPSRLTRYPWSNSPAAESP